MNNSFPVSVEDRTDFNTLDRGKIYDPDDTNFKSFITEKEKYLKYHFKRDFLHSSFPVAASANTKEDQTQHDISTNIPQVQTNVTVHNNVYGKTGTEKPQIFCQLSPKRNDKLDAEQGQDEIIKLEVLSTKALEGESSKTSTVMKDQHLKPKMSVVKIHDADGLTIKAQTSRQTVTGDICVITPSNKMRGKRKIEAKSAKRAAIVLLTFLIVWLPFPCVIMVSWYLHAGNPNQIQALISAYIVSMTLSLLAASVNPLVYGAINKQFYKEFTRLFKKCRQGCTKRLSINNN